MLEIKIITKLKARGAEPCPSLGNHRYKGLLPHKNTSHDRIKRPKGRNRRQTASSYCWGDRHEEHGITSSIADCGDQPSVFASPLKAEDFINVLTGGTPGFITLSSRPSNIYGKLYRGQNLRSQTTKASVENLNLPSRPG